MKYYRLQNYTNTRWAEFRTDGMLNSTSEKIMSVESKYDNEHNPMDLLNQFTVLGLPNRVGSDVTDIQLKAWAVANNYSLIKFYESNAGVVLNTAENSEALITSFKFANAGNDALSVDVVGVIDQDAKTIDLLVPADTVVTALIATFTASTDSVVVIGSTVQVSGTTPNDFTAAVTYKVTSEDGTTITEYAVTVT